MKVRFFKDDQWGNKKGQVKDLEPHIAKHVVSIGLAEHVVEEVSDLAKKEVKTNFKSKKK